MPEPTLPIDDGEMERAVRRAFAAYRAPVRAFTAPVASSTRSGRRPRLLIASLAGVPLVAVIVVTLAAQALIQPPSAYAGWTPVPSSPDPAVAAAAREECVTPEDRLAAILPLVAQDQRGQVALAFFTDGNVMVSCLVSRTAMGGATAVGVGRIDGPRTSTLRLLAGMSQEGAQPVEMVVGDAAPEVATVLIVRDDGSTVTATLEDGYFLAWWPDSAQPVTYTGLDKDGAVLEVIEHTY